MKGDRFYSIKQEEKNFNNLGVNDILILICRTKGKILKVLGPHTSLGMLRNQSSIIIRLLKGM